MQIPRIFLSRSFLLISVFLLLGVMDFEYLSAEYHETKTFGYGLDDSWIHATFARNLANGKGFTFNAGEHVSGSTAPLYTLVLAGWYKLSGEVLWGGKALGMLSLAVCCLFLFLSVERLAKDSFIAWYASILCVISAPLLVSNLSGMETCMYLASASAALYCYTLERYRLMIVMLAVGVWLRPEAVLLLAIGWFAIPNKEKLIAVAIGAAILLPYFALNYSLSQYPFPNTVRTKSNLVQGHFSGNFIQEAATVFSMTHFYPILMMIPLGFLTLWKKAWWIALFPVAYFVSIWATSMTVSNFGRYLYPILPFLYILAAFSIVWLTQILPTRSAIIKTCAVILLIVQCVVCKSLERTHALSVENIKDMQVSIAKVVPQITLPSDTVATNDVGAMGYFSNRYIVDMVGLITPPLSFEDNLRLHHPAFLAIFDSWYPQRTQSPTFMNQYKSLGAVELQSNVACGDKKMSLYAREDRFEDILDKLAKLQP
jgi:arabinofuranosyltransferase